MPRLDMFGRNWNTGEDIAMDSTIRALGGVKNLANYWAQYSDKIKEEEEKEREKRAKEEADKLKKEEKLQNEYFQIKSLRKDLPDDVALYIAQMEKGPYKSQLMKNIKTQKNIVMDALTSPFRELNPLQKLLKFHEEQGSLEPINQMQELIRQGTETTGKSPEIIVAEAVKDGTLTPEVAELLFPALGTPKEQWAEFLGRKAIETPLRVAGGAAESIANLPALGYNVATGIGEKAAEYLPEGPRVFDPSGELLDTMEPDEYMRLKKAYESQTPEEAAKTEKEIAPYFEFPELRTEPLFRKAVEAARGVPGVADFIPEKTFQEAKTTGERMYNAMLDTAGALLVGGATRGSTAALKGLKGTQLAKAATKVYGKKLARAVGAGAAGEIGKWAAQKAGASPLVAEGIKLGSIIFALQVGPKETAKISGNKYDSVRDAKASQKPIVSRKQTNNFIDEVNQLQKTGNYTPDPKSKNLFNTITEKTLGIKDGKATAWNKLNRSLGQDILIQESRIGRQQLQKPLLKLINAVEKRGPKDISKIREAINEFNSNWNELVYEGSFRPSQDTARQFARIKQAQQLSLNEMVNVEKTLNNALPKADSRDIDAIKKLKDGPMKNIYDTISQSSKRGADLVQEIREARQLFATSKEVGKVSKFLDSVMGKQNIGRYAIFGLLGGGFTTGAKIIGSTYATKQMVRATEQFIRNLRNPTLRKALAGTIKGALAGKATQSARELKKIIQKQQDTSLNSLMETPKKKSKQRYTPLKLPNRK